MANMSLTGGSSQYRNGSAENDAAIRGLRSKREATMRRLEKAGKTDTPEYRHAAETVRALRGR